MKIVIILTVISINLFRSNSQDSCQPLWPRLQFGNIFSDFSSPQKLVIKFNTRSTCPKSYVLVTDSKETIRKIYCDPLSIQTSQKTNNYKAFIQRCSIEQISFEQKFTYMSYGSNSTSGISIPFSREPTSFQIIHPNSTKTLKLVVLGDWSELHLRLAQYKSINQSLDTIRIRQNPHGLLINGDIAYNMDSNNGKNYQEFLNILSRFARFIPVFVNTGNHEHLTQDALMLFYGNFELYGKEKKLANSINLGPIFLIGFDPYQKVFANSTLSSNLRQEDPISLRGLAEALANGSKTSKIVIPSSHYPLKCSAMTRNCQNDTDILENQWNLMFENNIKFYIGAHYHTYQRLYPYCQNKTFSSVKAPYKFKNEKCIVSIIEGIAGNEQYIIESYDKVESYTAALSYGKTGFGLLTASRNVLNYKHFTSDNLLTLVDQFDMIYENQRQTGFLEE